MKFEKSVAIILLLEFIYHLFVYIFTIIGNSPQMKMFCEDAIVKERFNKIFKQDDNDAVEIATGRC